MTQQIGPLTQLITSVTGAPAWFTGLAERTWTDIAGGTSYVGQRFSAERQPAD